VRAKGAYKLRTYPVGVDVVEVARVPCHASDSNISTEDNKGFFCEDYLFYIVN
jgi:hypothetical protein